MSILLSVLLPAGSIRADYVGTGSVQLSLDPASAAVVLDGYQVGDEISYIYQQAPKEIDTGNVNGAVAYGTVYVPPGVEVIGAEFVNFVGGVYTKIDAKDTVVMPNGCGARGCRSYGAEFGNGKINEVQQDTGIFYSADPQTSLLGSPLSIQTTGSAVQPQPVHNQWDYNQTLAFGANTGALSGNTGKGNTPVVTTSDGATTYYGTGSGVAGPNTYYTNDYDPSCSASTTFKDDVRCTGPWNRIAYPNAKLGGTGPVLPTTANPGALLSTAQLTTAGHNLSNSNPLPSAVNAVRYVFGARTVGDIEQARITFRITNQAAFEASFTNNTFCADGTGGDYDKPGRGAQDSIWRYYEGNNHTCFTGNAGAALTKTPETVNGNAATTKVPLNSVIGFAMTFYNTTGSTLYDIELSDAPLTANLTLVPASTTGCPYTNYNGNQAGSTPTFNTISGGTATWNPLSSLAAGGSVTVHMCARVASSGVDGAEVRNQITARYALTSGGTKRPPLVAGTLQVIGTPTAALDFGDLPDAGTGTGTGNYQTQLSDNGPRHTIVSGMRLGAAIDAESNGQQNTTATGDDIAGATPDDEDGVTIPALTAGTTATITISSSAAGKVNAFIDWNNDGDFADANEALTQLTVAAGNNNLVVAVPANAVTGTPIGARFRLSSQGGLGATSAGLVGGGLLSDAEIGKYLVIAMGDDANIGRAFQMSNTEIGADREILSTANDPGYVTNGGLPNLLGVFGTRWNLTTNPDSLNNAAGMFQGVDWSGEVALTSDNGKFDGSNSLVFADTGIQSNHTNPLASVSNTKYFDVGQSAAPGTNIAIGNGVTTGNSYATLLSDLSSWKSFILGLSAETSITNQSAWTNNAASGGAGGLLTTYADALDTNNDGVIVVDFNISGTDFSVNNTDWVINGTGNKLIIFRLRNGSNMLISNGSILLGTGGIATGDLGVIFFSGYESSSSDSVFSFSNVVASGVAFWDLNAVGEGGSSTNTNIVINNGQGCAQFISQKVNFQNNRWNRCAPGNGVPDGEVEDYLVTVQALSSNPNYVITKVNNTDPNLLGVRKGETISFTVRITNTGDVPITILPLRDTYVDGILTYIGATPVHSSAASGQVDWDDLTSNPPTGFGVDLGVGQSFALIVEFVGTQDTTALPGGVTINTATVRNAFYDPDGPGGIPPQPLPDKSATAPAKIIAPTAVALAEASASYADAQATLRWRTANESDLIGFHIYRSENGAPAARLTDALLSAQKPGQSDGASYDYADASVETGKRYIYSVEFVGASGPLGQEVIGEILTGARLFLPTVGR